MVGLQIILLDDLVDKCRPGDSLEIRYFFLFINNIDKSQHRLTIYFLYIKWSSCS